MFRQILKSKIHKAIITDTILNYNGSIGIDKEILEKCGIIQGEKVMVLNYTTGNRLETYALEEEAGSGKIILYGPASRKGKSGEEICILAFCLAEYTEKIIPQIVYLNKENKIQDI